MVVPAMSRTAALSFTEISLSFLKTSQISCAAQKPRLPCDPAQSDV
jgi:hypothetical protein